MLAKDGGINEVERTSTETANAKDWGMNEAEWTEQANAKEWGINDTEWTEKAKFPNTDLAGWGLSWVFTTCPPVHCEEPQHYLGRTRVSKPRAAVWLAAQHTTLVLRSETGGGSQIRETMIPNAVRKLHSDSRRCLRHPSPTAVFRYAIRSTKLSANEQFFAGAQTAVILLQTTQIKQGVLFIAANKVYTSTNKTTIVWIETELFFFFFFFNPEWMRLVFKCVLWR